MAEFNIRTDSVDVEQIMRQIRARIKEKRGVDYTEQQIQELANVKLERFLDPKGVRSDLVEQFKRTRGTSPEPPNYGFEDTTLYETHRGFVRFFRRLLHPILKLLFNPNPIVHVLHMQGQINNINAQQFRVREELDALYYEVIHNLVLEVTRLGIEAKNLKMRLESLNSRMDFDERRARALEGVVQYRPGTGAAREPAFAKGSGEAAPSARSSGEARRERQAEEGGPTQRPPQSQQETQGELAQAQEAHGLGAAAAEQTGEASGAATATARRRRRRRRGRRGSQGRALGLAENPSAAATPPHGDATADAAFGSASAGPSDDDGAADTPYDQSDSGSDSGSDEEPDPSEQ